MRTSLHYLVHFIHLEFLEMHYYITKFRVRNDNKHLSIMNKYPSVPTGRILQTAGTPQVEPATGVNKL